MDMGHTNILWMDKFTVSQFGGQVGLRLRLGFLDLLVLQSSLALIRFDARRSEANPSSPRIVLRFPSFRSFFRIVFDLARSRNLTTDVTSI